MKNQIEHIQVKVTNREGSTTTFEAADGEVLMNLLRDHEQGVEAVCGGCCSCATCHVYVDDSWIAKLDPQADGERELLAEMNFAKPNSRLSCEIHLKPELSGIALTVAPPEA